MHLAKKLRRMEISALTQGAFDDQIDLIVLRYGCSEGVESRERADHRRWELFK